MYETDCKHFLKLLTNKQNKFEKKLCNWYVGYVILFDKYNLVSGFKGCIIG